MSAAWLLAAGIVVFLFGWFVYSRYVANHVLKLGEEFQTPAHEFRDDVDFTPANKLVLWGHHFTAVSGAAPIVGPAIAVKWGWLPAFLWVVLGSVFFAGIHDMSALWASVRHQGKSIGSVCSTVVSSKVGQLFIVVIFLVLLMVNSAFGVVIAGQLVDSPSAVIPTWGTIVIALVMGQLIYRFKWSLGWVTLGAVICLYLLVPLGTALPVVLPESFLGLGGMYQWMIILFVYCGIASILPVWMLLQPRDYVNGIQLFVALILLFAGIFIVSPEVIAPSIIPAISEQGEWGELIPVLFITVACGAISGFHGIVSSGTTSKQVNEYRDVRFVGYLGALGEGFLALATILACVAGVGLLAGGGGLTTANWAGLYEGSVSSFVDGGGAIIQHGLGLPASFSSTLLSLMVILFAATTMDAGIRLQRYIIQEWGDIYNIPVLRKNVPATLVAVISSFALAWGGVGEGGSNQVAIWPLFGASNQLLASLTLLVVAVMLMKYDRVRRSLVALVPMVFILVMSFWGALVKLVDYFQASNWLLLVLSLVVISITVVVVLSAFGEITRVLNQRKGKETLAEP